MPDASSEPEFGRSLDPGRCLLFVYGQLQPGRHTPRTTGRYRRDRVRGELFDLGAYAAARKVGNCDTWFSGYVLEIDEHELVTDLDPFEGVAEGEYRRVRTATESELEVWAYDYARPIPKHAIGPIAQWPRE